LTVGKQELAWLIDGLGIHQENAIRPFVVGRNWLFAPLKVPMPVHEANGLEPYWYLKYLFENLPEAMTADEFMALMPQNIDKTQIAGPAT